MAKRKASVKPKAAARVAAPPAIVPQANTKNIDSLIAATNESAGAARTAWLGFMGLITYLLITLAGVTHLDLLLNSPLTLPIVNVSIPLFGFFIYAPLFLLVMHMWVLLHHATLKRRVWRLEDELDDPDYSDVRRMRLLTTVVMEYFAGIRQGRSIHFLQGLLTWISIALLPLLTLLFFQARFLPYHSWEVTVWHRCLFFADVAVLLTVGIYLGGRAIGWRTALRKNIRDHKIFAAMSGAVLIGMSWFSGAVATHPDEWVRKYEEYVVITSYLFSGDYNIVSKSSAGLFARNIVLPDVNIMQEADRAKSKVGFNLRGRDLRYAVLANSNLEGIDAVGANFESADLTNTNFSKAILSCVARKENKELLDQKSGNDKQEREAIHPTNDAACFDHLNSERSGSSFKYAKLKDTDFSSSIASNADFSFAQIDQADFVGAKLRAARFLGAQIFSSNFGAANLRETDFYGNVILGSNFMSADLRDANIVGVLSVDNNYQFVDFFSSSFDLSIFAQSKLEGVDFWGAEGRLYVLADRHLSLAGAKAPDNSDDSVFSSSFLKVEFIFTQSEIQKLTDRMDWVEASSGLLPYQNRGALSGPLVTLEDSKHVWFEEFVSKKIAKLGRNIWTQDSMQIWKNEKAWDKYFATSWMQRERIPNQFLADWVRLACGIDLLPYAKERTSGQDLVQDESMTPELRDEKTIRSEEEQQRAIWLATNMVLPNMKYDQRWREYFVAFLSPQCVSGEELMHEDTRTNLFEMLDSTPN